MKYTDVDKLKQKLEAIPDKPKEELTLSKNQALDELAKQLWMLSKKGYTDTEIAEKVSRFGLSIQPHMVRYRIKKYRAKTPSRTKQKTKQVKISSNPAVEKQAAITKENRPNVTANKSFNPLIDSEKL